MSNESHTRRLGVWRLSIVYLLAAVPIFSLEIGFVRAADLPLPPASSRQYSDSREYYEEQLPPPQGEYVYRRPAPYYSPPPVTYYEYAPVPPTVLLEDEAYYLPPRYRYWGRGPYVARGYGRYDGRWARGYHRW
jgi:hypothetical protein